MHSSLLPLLALNGCFLLSNDEDQNGTEGTQPFDCTDRADNDGNGLFDCDDPGCANSPDCDDEGLIGGGGGGGTPTGNTGTTTGSAGTMTGTGNTGSTTSTTSTTTTTTTTATSSTSSTPVTWQLEGSVYDEDGYPVDGASVRACDIVLCSITTTAVDGSFDYDFTNTNPLSLEVVPPSGGLATGLTWVPYSPGLTDVVFTLPYLSVPQALPATPVMLGLDGNLLIEAGLGDLDAPLFMPQATAISGGRAPSWPDIPGVNDVLALWYLDPSSYVVINPMAVQLVDEWGRSDLHLYSLEYGDFYGWQDEGVLQQSLTSNYLEGVTTSRFAVLAVVAP